MSFSITNRLNNLAAQTASIISDLSQKQTIIGNIIDIELPGKQPLLSQTNSENGTPVIDTNNNIVRRVFTDYPLQASLYFNPLDENDNKNNHIQLDFDDSYSGLVYYYTKNQSDDKYQLKFSATSPLSFNSSDVLSIDLSNFYNKLETDAKYELKFTASSPLSFVDNLLSINLTNYATISYVTTAINNLINGANTSMDTLKELSNALNDDANFATNVINLINTKQNIISCDLPLSINNNIISLDLSSYYTKTQTDTQLALYQTLTGMSNYLTTANASATYQPKFSLNLPLSINNNIISIDLNNYYTKSQTDTQLALYQTLVGMGNYLTTANATSIYQPISSMTNYLTTANASSTYQTLSNISSVYSTNNNLYYNTAYINNQLALYQPISSMDNYLTISSASSTYQPISLMDNYLTITAAASNYQTISNRTDTYSSNSNLYYNTTYINTQLALYQTISSMTNYITSSSASSTYQPKFTLSLPLSINNNIISIDLSSYYTKTQVDSAISNSFNKSVTIKNDNDANNVFVINNSADNNLLTISGNGNLTSSGSITATSIVATGATPFQIKNGVTVNASISQAGTISGSSISTTGNITSTATAFNLTTSGSSILIKQTGDTYGASSISMMNRIGQNGFVVETYDTTTTLCDFALKNGSTNSLRSIRLESRTGSYTTGQHSLQFGLMTATPTLSIGDNYATFTKLNIGTQATPNTTPTDFLTINGTTKCTSTVTATSFPTSSDERLKKNIVDMDENIAIGVLKNVKSKTYELISDTTQTKRVGFIAQELKNVLPNNFNDIIFTDETDYNYVDYGRLTSLLWTVCRNMNARIEYLEHQLNKN